MCESFLCVKHACVCVRQIIFASRARSRGPERVRYFCELGTCVCVCVCVCVSQIIRVSETAPQN